MLSFAHLLSVALAALMHHASWGTMVQRGPGLLCDSMQQTTTGWCDPLVASRLQSANGRLDLLHAAPMWHCLLVTGPGCMRSVILLGTTTSRQDGSGKAVHLAGS